MTVSKEILEQEHSAENYLRWVKDLIARTNASENGLESIMLRTEISKQILEEALQLVFCESTLPR